MLPVSNANTTSHRTQNKVERELKRADKEYAKAEKGFQKGSIRRAEKHENRGMAHELKADGLLVGSHHGHNEGTRVAMMHNSQLTAAQPTITPMAGPAIIPATTFVQPTLASTGFETSGRGLDYLPQSSSSSLGALGGQSFAQQTFGPQQGLAPQQGSFISVPHGPGMTTTVTTQPSTTQRF